MIFRTRETLSKDFLGKTFFWWQIGGRSCSCLPKNFSSPSSSPSIQSCSVFSRKVPWRRFIWSKSAISATWSEWHSWRDRRTPRFYVATQHTFQPQILHFGTGITYQGARNWGRPRRFHGLALPSGTFRYDYFALYGLTAWFTDGYFSTLYYCTLFLLLTDRPFPRVFQPEWCILVDCIH